MPRRAMSDDGDAFVDLEFDLDALPGPSTCIVDPLPSPSVLLTEIVEAALATSESTNRSWLEVIPSVAPSKLNSPVKKGHLVPTWALARGRSDTAVRL